ncbi:hypothetical protein GF323_03995 [Candidatus Woesearchaeota archaeon]|nr:hypothetical protein [Candidatus Woesearchaeota archaeon]
MLAEKAYLEMYPESRLGKYEFSLKYSGRFNAYNANVRRKGRKIEFCLSSKWKQINQDVKIGLLQGLFNKIFRTNINTANIELYEIFIKKIHIATPKVSSDPVLERSFDRINEQYFNGLIEKPNLKWGRESTTKLGSYEYGSDTITISSIFKPNEEFLDYIMHHEMLHKKHKFHTKNGKSYHHTREFNCQEGKFRNRNEIEGKLNSFLGKLGKSARGDLSSGAKRNI